MRPQASKSYQASREAWALQPLALDRWKPQMRGNVKAAAGVTVIDMYDVIGFDFWTGGGVTSETVAAQIRGQGDLVININSPGGDFFEGLAIHNLLRAHKGRKTVNIVALAASAASLIAAAGDEVRIAPAAYVMIHNVWGLVVGNKNDMSETAKVFEKFDQGARVIYAEQTGKPDAEIDELMGAESWFLGKEAVDEGFATSILPADATLDEGASAKVQSLDETMPLRRAEAQLCQVMPRREARQFLKKYFNGGTQDAVPDRGTQDAAAFAAAADCLRGILSKV